MCFQLYYVVYKCDFISTTVYNNNNDDDDYDDPLILNIDRHILYFTLLYIVKLFLTFADVIGENHELIFLQFHRWCLS